MTSIRKKNMFFAVLLFLAPALFLGAQQSFFIAPGTEIENGEITRGYCLERNQPVISAGNIGNLTNITGLVDVTYKNGSVQRGVDFANLLQTGRIAVSALGSAQFVRMNMDEAIEKISVAKSGIVMARQNMSNAQKELVAANVKLLTETGEASPLHQAMQNAAWRTQVPAFNKAAGAIRIDFRNSPEGERLRGRYDGSAAVIYDLQTNTFRFDGLEHDPVKAQTVYDFLTHFHSDHADTKTLEGMYQKGLKGTLMYPMPALESSQKKKAFELVKSITETGEYQIDTQNSVYKIAPAEGDLLVPAINSTMGQFLYSRYRFGELTVETFKYLNPKNENTDGLIYRLTRKNVSQLLFGDFDDEKVLSELLEHSKTNQEKQDGLLEKYYDLEGQLHSIPGWENIRAAMNRARELREQPLPGDSDEEENLLYLFENYAIQIVILAEYASLVELLDGNPGGEDSLVIQGRMRELEEEFDFLADDLAGKEDMIEGLAERMAAYEEFEELLAANPNRETILDILNQRQGIQEQLNLLPTLQADIVKWPHHAHIFKSRELIEQMNAVINPRYFIYQAHPAQEKDPRNPVKFREMIQGLDFEGKFINSAEYDVEIISLYFLRMMDRYLSLAQAAGGLS